MDAGVEVDHRRVWICLRSIGLAADVVRLPPSCELVFRLFWAEVGLMGAIRLTWLGRVVFVEFRAVAGEVANAGGRLTAGLSKVRFPSLFSAWFDLFGSVFGLVCVTPGLIGCCCWLGCWCIVVAGLVSFGRRSVAD